MTRFVESMTIVCNRIGKKHGSWARISFIFAYFLSIPLAILLVTLLVSCYAGGQTLAAAPSASKFDWTLQVMDDKGKIASCQPTEQVEVYKDCRLEDGRSWDDVMNAWVRDLHNRQNLLLPLKPDVHVQLEWDAMGQRVADQKPAKPACKIEDGCLELKCPNDGCGPITLKSPDPGCVGKLRRRPNGTWEPIVESCPEPAPKPEAIDIPAIRVKGDTHPAHECRLPAELGLGTSTRLPSGVVRSIVAMSEQEMHYIDNLPECETDHWTCDPPTRILEHDESVPPHFYCRKPQTEAPTVGPRK